MSIGTILLLLELASFAIALPAGGSGGSRGGTKGSGGSSGGSSSGGSSGGSSSSSGGSSGSNGGKYRPGWTSSRNNGSRSTGPLSKTAKIVLAVIGGKHSVLRDRYKQRKKAKHLPSTHEKVPSSEPSSAPSSARSSVEGPATLSHNPGHTQAAVHPTAHPTTNAELTSAVMAGEGSRAGHGESGADSGSRGGVGQVQWEARALAVISKGMSTSPHSTS